EPPRRPRAQAALRSPEVRPRVVRLRVAGTTLAARASGDAPGLALPKKLAPFVPPRGDDIRLTLSSEPVPDPGRSSLLFESGGLWQVFEAGSGLLYRFRSPLGDGPPPARGLRIDSTW